MSGQALQEQPGLTREERDVLRFIETDFLSSDGPSKDALGKWAASTWRAYMTAGCEPAAIIERLPRFLKILEDELADLRSGFQGQAAEPDQTATPKEIAANVKEDLAWARAVEALLDRLSTASLTLGAFGRLARPRPSRRRV